jgi:hypothetical protein
MLESADVTSSLYILGKCRYLKIYDNINTHKLTFGGVIAGVTLAVAL